MTYRILSLLNGYNREGIPLTKSEALSCKEPVCICSGYPCALIFLRPSFFPSFSLPDSTPHKGGKQTASATLPFLSLPFLASSAIFLLSRPGFLPQLPPDLPLSGLSMSTAQLTRHRPDQQRLWPAVSENCQGHCGYRTSTSSQPMEENQHKRRKKSEWFGHWGAGLREQEDEVGLGKLCHLSEAQTSHYE